MEKYLFRHSKRNKRSVHKYIFFLCLFLVLTLIPVPVAAATQQSQSEKKEQTTSKTVKVGWYEDSYHITGKNGERSGYAYEYEQAVSAYTGWTYQYVKGDWEELLSKLQKGEIDLMAAISYTDERAKTMLFSDEPMGEEKYYLYADLTHAHISPSDLSTLNGKRVAVMEKSVQATQFSQWEKKHNIKTQHINVDSFEKAKKMVEKQELDGVISTETPAWVEAGMSAIATTGQSGIYYAINKNRPDLKKEIDNAMRAMEYDKPFYADELYQRYLASQSVAVLSGEEKKWLSKHGEIKVGYIKDDPGVSGVDSKSGRVVGVLSDYIDYARDSLDQKLYFNLVQFDSEEEQIQALKEGKIDMIFHISQNPYYAEKNDLSLSNTVLTIPLAVVTTQDFFDEDAQNTVAIEKGNCRFKWYVSYNYPNWKIKEYDSLKAAQKAVKAGKADCFLVRSSQSMRYVNDKKLHSVFLTKSGNTSFAVKKGNSVLMSILNKTLKTIQTSKLSGAVSVYEDSQKKVTLADFVKDNLVAVSIGFVTVFLLVMIVFLRLLQKARIAEENTKKSQLQAEQANAAKSTFLFNMSHDIRTPMNALLGYNQLMKKELTEKKLLHYQEKIEQSGNLLLSIINNVLDMARIESGKMELDENYARVGKVVEEIYDVFESEATKKGVHFIQEVDVVHEHILCDITKVEQILLNLISNAVKYTDADGIVKVKIQEIPCDQEGYARIKTEVTDTGIGMSEDYLPRLFDSFTRERNTTAGKVAGTGLGMTIVKELVDMMGGSIEVESELGKGSKFTVILNHKIADEKYYTQKSKEITPENKKEIMQGKHILLAEDNGLNAEIAITILNEMGIKVDRVEDGIQCVSKVEQKPADTYDLVLMDIQMPNMDGYKATEAIRALSDKKKAEIPIIAMTANAFEEDKKEALSKGMNGHIAKPIDVKKVEEVLLSVLR